MTSKPAVEPIRDADLGAFAVFLQANLDPAIPVEAWVRAFQNPWAEAKPNNGFMLRSGGQIVGGIGAIYADQTISGQRERFCNLTSWCVLDEYRSQSMRLAMALVTQEGYHFTDFTPIEVVRGALGFLKFREMDRRFTLIPNVPRPRVGSAKAQVVSDADEIERILPREAVAVYRDHRHLPWLEHVAVGREGAFCLVVFKREPFAKLPAATVLGVSAPELFARFQPALCSYLLVNLGLLFTRVDTRLQLATPLLSLQRRGVHKMFRSETLHESQIGNLYSELVALDI
jgi:hypothetical protein